jgi:hypothetical protein
LLKLPNIKITSTTYIKIVKIPTAQTTAIRKKNIDISKLIDCSGFLKSQKYNTQNPELKINDMLPIKAIKGLNGHSIE